jgi:hypothetical protein
MVSTWRWIEEWRKNPTDAYLANVRTNLENAEAFPRILATPLPSAVMPEWVSVKFPTSARLILLMRPDVRFHDADGQTRVLDAGGNLVPVKNPKVITASKPAQFCAAQIPGASEQGARVPFTKPAFYAPGAQVEVGLLLEEQTRVEVQVEKPDGTLVSPERWSDDVLPKGPHTVRYPVPYAQTIQAVHVKTSNGVIACVTRAQVWVEAP